MATKLRTGLSLCLFLIACGGDDLLPPAAPQHLTIVSGNLQEGSNGVFLAEPFVVRATGAGGAGIANALVRWSIVSGSGAFGVPPTTLTGADGVASITFMLLRSGTTTVSAEVMGSQGSPATFTAISIAPGSVLIRFGAMFDCYGVPNTYDPSIFSPEVTVQLGTLVEWEYADYMPSFCSAQVRSVSVPPGASHFQSGILYPGQRFGVVLNVAGDWQFEDVLNGGRGTVRVQP